LLYLIRQTVRESDVFVATHIMHPTKISRYYLDK
jgi:hypothetical protein